MWRWHLSISIYHNISTYINMFYDAWSTTVGRRPARWHYLELFGGYIILPASSAPDLLLLVHSGGIYGLAVAQVQTHRPGVAKFDLQGRGQARSWVAIDERSGEDRWRGVRFLTYEEQHISWLQTFHHVPNSCAWGIWSQYVAMYCSTKFPDTI